MGALKIHNRLYGVKTGLEHPISALISCEIPLYLLAFTL